MPGDPTYIKRYRMELPLRILPPPPDVPAGFNLLAWRNDLLESHAEVKFQCFRDELDALVFPSLGHRAGCSDLMWNISTRANFVPEATWLLAGPFGTCATVQGLRDKYAGAIQNLGVIPDHRGRGLGKLLLLKALHGFRQAGLRSAYLEVTASNESAIHLYRQFGFRPTRTIYKTVAIIPNEALVVI